MAEFVSTDYFLFLTIEHVPQLFFSYHNLSFSTCMSWTCFSYSFFFFHNLSFSCYKLMILLLISEWVLSKFPILTFNSDISIENDCSWWDFSCCRSLIFSLICELSISHRYFSYSISFNWDSRLFFCSMTFLFRVFSFLFSYFNCLNSSSILLKNMSWKLGLCCSSPSNWSTLSMNSLVNFRDNSLSISMIEDSKVQQHRFNKMIDQKHW